MKSTDFSVIFLGAGESCLASCKNTEPATLWRPSPFLGKIEKSGAIQLCPEPLPFGEICI